MMTRSEFFTIQLELDKTASQRHTKALETIQCYHGDVRENDVLKVDYNFSILYYSYIEKGLLAVESICRDPSVVISEKHGKLHHGVCVIEQVILALNTLKETLEKRS